MIEKLALLLLFLNRLKKDKLLLYVLFVMGMIILLYIWGFRMRSGMPCLGMVSDVFAEISSRFDGSIEKKKESPKNPKLHHV